MDNRRIAGLVLITIGLFGLASFVPPYAAQLQSYSGWGSLCGMMSGMMGGYNANPGGQRITIDRASRIAQLHLSSFGNPDIAIYEIMEFQYNFYVLFYEKSTGVRAFEMLVDPYTGQIFPEYGPDMMWNAKYGMMGGVMMWGYGASPMASMPVTKDQAKVVAEDYLKAYLSGATVEEPDTFYGYYTVHILKDGKIYGMLSVNGYDGQVWYHSWHGQFIQVKGF